MCQALSWDHHRTAGKATIIPILEMKKLRLREHSHSTKDTRLPCVRPSLCHPVCQSPQSCFSHPAEHRALHLSPSNRPPGARSHWCRKQRCCLSPSPAVLSLVEPQTLHQREWQLQTCLSEALGACNMEALFADGFQSMRCPWGSLLKEQPGS